MKPFLTDRPQVPLKSLVPPAGKEGLGMIAKTPSGAAGPRITTGRGSAGTTGCAAPQVEAIKQGDKVVRLVVTCSCGERVEIDCLYPAGG
ncbi:MAG TPA: hypothetical protein VHF69_07460 [Candidatus Synoicihabitans sp.]|nr:hypothetical protein [Candidatus Synoicihabitans sp.]